MVTSTISAGFIQPHSIHPKIQVDISGHKPKECDLHLFIRTNDKIFFDPYELEDVWQPSGATLDSPKDVVSWDLSPSVPDLERPVMYGFKGSKGMHNETMVENQLHVELAWPKAGLLRHIIPTHARYQQPDMSGHRQFRISALDTTASAFACDVDVRALWSCQAASSSMSSTMDRADLDQDITKHLSGAHLYNIDSAAFPSSDMLSSTILLPAAVPSHQAFVESITLCVVTGCFLWIIKVLVEVARRPSKPAVDPKVKAD